MLSKIKKISISILNWFRENQRKNSGEYLEDEEFEEFVKKVEKRMDKITAAQKAETHESRAQVALMFENAYTQKKITDANKILSNSTIILAIATAILAYTALADSVNKWVILNDLKNIFAVFVLIIFIIVLYEILKNLTKFIFGFVKNRK